ncbi:MAG: choice-of-anchor Q domain-containing protein [bacterium]|nr:choice-of-anchor Q domain-containing protein [bacterium]
MKHHLWVILAVVFIGMGLFLPQAITYAATVTYTTCPTYATLSADASTPGTITFNVAGGCTVIFDESIFIDSAVTITNIGDEVIFDGDDSTYHFDIDGAGNLTLNNLVLYNGYGEVGGSIYNLGVLTVIDSVFDYNYADDAGGAIFNCCGTVTITNTDFIDNEAYYDGGAIFTSGGTVTITGGSFDSNVVEERGGGIFNDGGTLSISGTHFENNEARDEEGGAIYNDDGSLTVMDSTFEGNYANSGWGGAIGQEDGIATIMGSSFYDNYASDGGAVNNDYGTMTISRSSFYNNMGSYGGALYNYDGGVLNVSNSTFYGNEAFTEGGAFYNDDGTATFTHVTIVSNFAPVGATLYNYDGASTIIIASILAGGECYLESGSLNDGGNNIQFNAPNCVGTTTDPMLGAFTGGFLIPADGSPAIDAMPTCILGDDQIGTARPQGAGCDIGAIEGGGGFVVPIPSGPIVLGCVFDTPTGIELSNLPDNTYCTVLMKNGTVINYSGAVPADLIGLGVIFAVDVYRLEGGRSILEFPDYGRVCLRGNGRMFYMDARNMPRYSIEMPTESVDGMTCAWIPAPGTLILTN